MPIKSCPGSEKPRKPLAWMVESKGGRDQNSVAYFGRLAGDKQRTFGTFSVVKLKDTHTAAV